MKPFVYTDPISLTKFIMGPIRQSYNGDTLLDVEVRFYTGDTIQSSIYMVFGVKDKKINWDRKSAVNVNIIPPEAKALAQRIVNLMAFI
jgi:hypothetical protein